ncbi:Uncharacterized protein FKW44_009468, partial [Caligus rogercresseyi]
MDDMSNPYEMLTKDPMEKASNLNLYPRKRELEHALEEKERSWRREQDAEQYHLMISSYEKNPSFGSKKDTEKFNVERSKYLSQKDALEREVSSLTGNWDVWKTRWRASRIGARIPRCSS